MIVDLELRPAVYCDMCHCALLYVTKEFDGVPKSYIEHHTSLCPRSGQKFEVPHIEVELQPVVAATTENPQ